MKATINGIEVEGTPKEIAEYQSITKSEKIYINDLTTAVYVDGRQLAKSLDEVFDTISDVHKW